MNRLQPKILIIGIDGATFDLIEPWADQGKLPTFKSLLDEGVHGELKSTIPPVTAPAWTSFMTGMNPGRHGLFDFLEPNLDRYGMRYTNGRSRKAKTLWNILSEAGLRVGAMNVPMTYPPEPVNGFLISGMDTPDENCEFTYPKSLRDELKRAVGGLQIDIRHLGHMRTDQIRDTTLMALEALEERRTQAALYLLEHRPTDALMVVFNATDQVQHHFWHYFEPSHPQHDAQGAHRYGDAILRIYQKIDDSIARLLRAVSEKTAIILVSDHGAGPVGPNNLYLNRFLQQLGLMKTIDPSPSGFGLPALFSQKVDALLRGWLTPQQKLKWSKRFPRIREKWESFLSFGPVDWKRTKAYAFENAAVAPNIWINLKGKRPNGIVEPGKDYEDTVVFLRKKLLELVDPLTGKPIIPAVYHKNEIYCGPYSDNAPDLILDWWSDSQFVIKQSFPCHEDDPIVVRRGRTLASGTEWSGTHRMNGLMLFKGPGFTKGRQDGGATIIDMAPTVLFYLGVPIPEDMDGKMIEAVFEDSFLRSHPLTYQKIGKNETGAEEQGYYSDAEAEKIRERLAGLGYLE